MTDALIAVGLILGMSVIGGPLVGLLIGTVWMIPTMLFKLDPLPVGAQWVTVWLTAGATVALGLAFELPVWLAVVCGLLMLVTAIPRTQAQLDAQLQEG